MCKNASEYAKNVSEYAKKMFQTMQKMFQDIQKMIQNIKIDSIVNSKVSENEPGLMIGIVKDGEIIYENYKGLANVEHQVKIGSKTRSNIASTAKQFTALMVLKLALNPIFVTPGLTSLATCKLVKIHASSELITASIGVPFSQHDYSRPAAKASVKVAWFIKKK